MEKEGERRLERLGGGEGERRWGKGIEEKGRVRKGLGGRVRDGFSERGRG